MKQAQTNLTAEQLDVIRWMGKGYEECEERAKAKKDEAWKAQMKSWHEHWDESEDEELRIAAMKVTSEFGTAKENYMRMVGRREAFEELIEVIENYEDAKFWIDLVRNKETVKEEN